MSERKAPERHPSTAIPPGVIEEITYRVYLRRLEPPMRRKPPQALGMS